MKLHGNAHTCLHSRSLIVERVLEQRWTVAAPARLRQESHQRRKEGAIGWDQRRAPLSTCEHDELMSQHEQLDVLSELATAAPDQEPQHAPITRHRGSEGRTSVLRLTSCGVLRDLGFARA